MNRSLLSLLAVILASDLALAAPVPKVPVEPISVDNAHKLRVVAEIGVEKTAYKMIRGPGTGEWTLLDYNKSVEVVDDVNFRTLRKPAKDQQPTDFAVSRDGKYQAWTSRNTTSYTLEEIATGKTTKIEVGKDPGYAAFSHDSKWIAIGQTDWKNAGGGASEMRIYDLTGKLIHTLDKVGAGAVTPVFSSDGKTLAVGNRNHETCLYEVATGKLLHKLDRKMTQEVAFCPDGRTLAAGYVDGSIATWDVATGKMLNSAATGGTEVYSITWCPKGKLLASSGLAGKVVVWDAEKLTAVKELDAAIWVIKVRFSEDGSRLMASSSTDTSAKNDRKITVWGLKAGKE